MASKRWESLPFVALLLMSGCHHDAVSVAKPDTARAMVALATEDPSLDLAESWATSECMARHGFHWPPFRILQGQVAHYSVFGFSKFTVSEAGRFGYELLTSRRPLRNANPQVAVRAYESTLARGRKRAFDLAANGASDSQVHVRMPDGAIASTSTSGCIAAARAQVYGSITTFLYLSFFPQEIRTFDGAALQSPSVAAAASIYSGCMKAAGYSVRYPHDAVASAASHWGTRPSPEGPSRDEMVMAEQDARCQSRSHIFDAIIGSVLHASSAWRNAHRSLILALLADKTAAQARASQILGASSHWAFMNTG
jgi:hypothetical protein